MQEQSLRHDMGLIWSHEIYAKATILRTHAFGCIKYGVSHCW